MFGYSRYTGDDVAETQSIAAPGINSILDRAKERTKRKRQEETFTARAAAKEQQESAKQQKAKKKKQQPIRPVRAETLDERNARKAAAKAARKQNKNGSTVEEAVATSDEVVIPAAEISKTKQNNNVTPTTKIQKTVDFTDINLQDNTNVAMEVSSDKDYEDDDDDNTNSAIVASTEDATVKPAAFIEQLKTNAKNVTPRSVQIDDEDDELMDRVEVQTITQYKAPPPITVEQSIKDWGIDEIFYENSGNFYKLLDFF